MKRLYSDFMGKPMILIIILTISVIIILQVMNYRIVTVLLCMLIACGLASDCQQLCQSDNTCSGSSFGTLPCEACYQGFEQSDPVESLAAGAACSCPVGFYSRSASELCYFCPMRCISCISSATCTLCHEGFDLINGSCRPYQKLPTTGAMQFAAQLDNEGMSKYQAHGFTINQASNVNKQAYFTQCNNMPGMPFYGVGIFDYNTLLTRTYYALPKHQFVQISFHYLIQDQWEGEGLVVEIEDGVNSDPNQFEDPPFRTQTSYYDNSMRHRDLCGFTIYPDSLGIYSIQIPHTASMLKIRIRTTLAFMTPTTSNINNVYFAVRDFLMVLGSCPRHCTICSGQRTCGGCESPYVLAFVNGLGTCVCDTNVAVETLEGNCIVCGANEVVQHNRCILCEVREPGCLECEDSSGCDQCRVGYFMKDGQCYQVCPKGYYEVPDEMECHPCSEHCLTCEAAYVSASTTPAEPICSLCVPGFKWHDGQCYEQCPEGTYMNFAQTHCYNCPDTCVNCISPYICLECVEGYQMVDWVCRPICHSTENDVNPVVMNKYTGCPDQVCSAQCTKCFGPGSDNCYECADTYLLQGHSCVSSCSSGYYQWFDRCELCPQQCSECTGPHLMCSKCQIGYWLFDGKCINKCPTGYYHSSLPVGSFECRPCTIPDCHQCTQAPIGSSSGYSTDSESQPMCIECSLGLFLSIEFTPDLVSTCLPEHPECPIQYYYNKQLQSCQQCRTGCDICEQGELCHSCADGYFLNNGQCVLTCPIGKHPDTLQNICQWDSPLCEQYDASAATCSECIYISPSLIYDSAQCLFSCPDGQGRSTLLPQTCDVTCPTNCLQCDHLGKCVECEDDYRLSLGVCQLNCPISYVYDGSQCVMCPPKCLACQLDGTCIECEAGLELDAANGFCHDPACPYSERLDANSPCTVCQAQCHSCTINPDQCTTCAQGLFLHAGGICQDVCPAGYFPDQATQQCRPCPPTCDACSSPQMCTSCIQGYFMYSQFKNLTSNQPLLSQCLSQCPVGYFIDAINGNTCTACVFPCRTCFGGSNSQCMDCISGYSMQQTTCVSECPPHKYTDQFGHCDFCSDLCQQCLGPASFQCLTCLQGSYLFQGRCYEQSCPPLTSYNFNLTYCVLCSEYIDGCIRCQDGMTNSITCEQCEAGYHLYHNQCHSYCPSGTYHYSEQSSRSPTCRTCSQHISNCLICEQEYCLQCASNYYSAGGSCVRSCPQSQYPLNNDGPKTCIDCPEYCDECEGSTASWRWCSSCKYHHKLSHSGQCLHQCEDGYYFNSSRNYETQCSRQCQINHCSQCYFQDDNETEGCSHCESGYLLHVSADNGLASCKRNNSNCLAGWFLNSHNGQYNICEPCFQTCARCVGSALNCTSCISSSYIIQNGLCIKLKNDTLEPYPLCENLSPTATAAVYCALCADEQNCAFCYYPAVLDVITAKCVLVCPQGYYAHLRICQRCSDGCLSCYGQSQNCSSCTSGFYLQHANQYSGLCVLQCPVGYFAEPSSNECEPCSRGCLSCISFTQCTQCDSSWGLASDSFCYPSYQCPLTTYYNSTAGQCLSCLEGCEVCGNSVSCSICSPDYSHFMGQCVAECPSGTYENVHSVTYNYNLIISSQCSLCSPPCMSCSNSHTCLQCLPGYIINNRTCVTACPQGYFKKEGSLNQTSCEKCSASCLACQGSSTSCTKCPDQSYLFESQCLYSCPAGLYASSTGHCRSCGDFCMQCLDGLTCTVCLEGFYLLEGKCIQKCPYGYTGVRIESAGTLTYNHILLTCRPCTSPCQECTQELDGSQYHCLSCLEGFYYHEDKCLARCPVGFFADQQSLTCKQCHDRCLTCSSYDTCLTCRYPGSSQCVERCVYESATCIPCDDQTCRYCDATVGECLQCEDGLYLLAGACVDECPLSPIAYYQNEMIGECSPCSEGCADCHGLDSCLYCSNGYYLYAGECFEGHCPVYPALMIVQETNGMECHLEPCMSYGADGQCTSCISPYVLVFGQCLEVEECPDLTFMSSTLSQCLPCPLNCVCQSSDSCLSCYGGLLYYAPTASCVKQCPFGTYASYPTMQCLSCNITGCQWCASATQCVLCQSGTYSLHVGNQSTCVTTCPQAYFASSNPNICTPCHSSCIQCTSTSNCTACSTGYYFVEGSWTCVSQCGQGYYRLTVPSTFQQCKQCPTSCVTCTSSTICQSCRPDYFKITFNSASVGCVDVCPEAYYANPLNQTCSLCLNGCSCMFNAQTGGSTCYSCPISTYLWKGVCYAQCPSGSYFPVNQSISDVGKYCLPCDPLCRNCSSYPQQCTACLTGYILSGNTCIRNKCINQPQKYYSTTTLSCVPCSSQCYQCYGSLYNQCLSCQYPLVYYPESTICVDVCPAGTIEVGGVCQKCTNPTCKECSGTVDKCSSCYDGMKLIPSLGVCVSECPAGWYYEPSAEQCATCVVDGCQLCHYDWSLQQSVCEICEAGKVRVSYPSGLYGCEDPSVCPNVGFYISTIDQSCLACSANCATCASISSCTECESGYFLTTAQECVTQCPQRTTQVNMNGVDICVECNSMLYLSNCIACTSTVNPVACTLCSPPYFLFDNVCVSSCPSGYTIQTNPQTLLKECQTSQQQEQTCMSLGLVSFFNQTTSQWTCRSSCPDSYYNDNQGKCMPCNNGCTKCLSSSTCLKCSTGFISMGGTCVSECPSNYINISSSCQPCLPLCQGCVNSPSECTYCVTGYYFVVGSGECLAACPVGFYADAATGICKQCASMCKQCNDNTGCTVCMNPTLSPSLCSDTCSSGEYMSVSSGCQPCYTTCLECFGSTSTSCLSCELPLSLLNGKCVSSCSAQYYLDTDTNKCVKCSSSITGCKTCSFDPTSPSRTQCNTCATPLLLSPDSQLCISACSILNDNTHTYSTSATNPLQCEQCISGCSDCVASHCYACSNDYYITNPPAGSGLPQECTVQCGVGYYQSVTAKQCLACGLADCLECTSKTVCTKCDAGKFLYNGRCESQCPLEYYVISDAGADSCGYCRTFDAHCSDCDNSTADSTQLQCLICESPYALTADHRCNSCQDGYYYNTTQESCIQCSRACSTCSSSTNCLTCSNSLVLNAGQCVVSCPVGKYLLASQCISCSDSGNIYCTSCSSDGSQCLSCAQGTYLYQNNCLDQCVDSTYPSVTAGACLPCGISNCAKCSSNVNICNECLTNFYLTSAGTCVLDCPDGTTEVTLANGALVCQSCKSGCQLCQNGGDECVQCQNGLTAQPDGTCIYDNNFNLNCNSGQYSTIQTDGTQVCSQCYSLCLECIGGSPSQCLSCRAGYVLQNGYCVGGCLDPHQYYSTGTSTCEECADECLRCTGPTALECLSCSGNMILNPSLGTCIDQCPVSTYMSNYQCKACPDLCLQCIAETVCTTCDSSATIFYSNRCYTQCPTHTYEVSSTPLNSCTLCSSICVACQGSATNCSACSDGYFLYTANHSCILHCPTNVGLFDDTTTRECSSCTNPQCLACAAGADHCTKCTSNYMLYNLDCYSSCPTGTYFKSLSTTSKICVDCPTGCIDCSAQNNCLSCEVDYWLLETPTSATCVQECPTGYTQAAGDNACINDKCQGCVTCVDNNKCIECEPGVYLVSNGCESQCPATYYEDSTLWVCQPCMDNCLLCPNSTFCEECQSGYNFSTAYGNVCIDIAYLEFGALSNMSGFTSNITETTSMIYLATSIGPAAFGEMSNTYFNIELCQFMFFHDSLAQGNQEMSNFISSLSLMSMSQGGGDNSTAGRRRMLASDTMAFLEINIPIFIFMGASLVAYFLIWLIHRNIDNLCLSCPRIQFYTKQICEFMFKRFKWIYFDFVAWISYIPFLYFSLVQVKNISFQGPLMAFSSILSIAILITYPLYPLLIAYQIKQNYRAICYENNTLVEMALSPWLWKVKRPEIILNDQQFVYCSKENWRLIYYPLKYFRKFLYVLVLAVCPFPVTTLAILIGINIVFIGYMAALRPRSMPYMIFDFIIEGVLLAFEIFMMVYISLNPNIVSGMSIATHFIGFLTANISIIAAIILNLIAYYKIFICIKDLVAHLKQKAGQKEKLDNTDKADFRIDEQILQELNDKELEQVNNYYIGEITNNELILSKDIDSPPHRKKRVNDDDITQRDEEVKTEQLGDEERNIAELMADKDLIMNGIQPRYDGDIRITNNQANNDNFNSLFEDKELYGGEKKQIRKSNGDADDGELPTMKAYKEGREKARKDKRGKKKQEKKEEASETAMGKMIHVGNKSKNREEMNKDQKDVEQNSSILVINRSGKRKSNNANNQRMESENSIASESSQTNLISRNDKKEKPPVEKRSRFSDLQKGPGFNQDFNSSDRNLKDEELGEANPTGMLVFQTKEAVGKESIKKRPSNIQPITGKTKDIKRIQDEFDQFADEIDDAEFRNNPKYAKDEINEDQDNQFVADGVFEDKMLGKNKKNPSNAEIQRIPNKDRKITKGYGQVRDSSRQELNSYSKNNRANQLDQSYDNETPNANYYDRKGGLQKFNQKDEGLQEGLFANRKPTNNKNLPPFPNRTEKLKEGTFEERQGKGRRIPQTLNFDEDSVNQGQFRQIEGVKKNNLFGQDQYTYEEPHETPAGRFSNRALGKIPKGNLDAIQSARLNDKSKPKVQSRDEGGFFEKKSYEDATYNDAQSKALKKDDYKIKRPQKNDDTFEEGQAYARRKVSDNAAKQTKGNLYINENGQFEANQYSRPDRASKINSNRTSKANMRGKRDDYDSFEPEDVPKRSKRESRNFERDEDNGLIVNDRRDDEGQDGDYYRKKNVSLQERQKLKKFAALNTSERGDFQEQPNAVRRQRERLERPSRIGNAKLNIQRREGEGEESEELDTVQL